MAAKNDRVVAVIPARWASERFPGKVLVDLCGKPMIQWVHERVSQASRIAEVWVATEDERVARCVEGFGGRVALTSPDHATGTDRVAEAVRGLEADWILNVQGDEPLVPPGDLDRLIEAMLAHPECEMGTLAVPLEAEDPDFGNPDVVKLVLSADGNALYFSRSPIPFARADRPHGAQPLRHWGIYAFRRDYLERFVTIPRSPLERSERLEQLRALEDGARIRVVQSSEQTLSVDRPRDAERVAALMKELGVAE
ncbi:MAG: 3-deoxy-manno-octulosonate cytidylyltransferase [Myxococcales bacterium]|nr:3-deoxy-manno-octulosonate cytidylyltransferase [Myxococcales bacterium]